MGLAEALGSNPTCAFHRYLCCDTQMELREWFATFLSVQVLGAGSPPEAAPGRMPAAEMAS